ncbi:MAG: tRNA epoxyqueuosine(34) reductase QueG [Chitinophagales bacterium]
MISTSTYSHFIKETAKQLGFSHIGIAKADFLADEAPKLETWLKQNYHGQMQYMENYFDMRLDPRKLVDNAKSVISLSYNYYTEKKQNQDSFKISKYAFGEDYHHVVKEKLKILLQKMQTEIGNINGRVFVDSAPVLERAWAVKSGIGWIGKHSLLINKNQGSFFFLAEIIVDVELEYDTPFSTDHCGTCTACIDACPTNAIVENKVVDGSKCISYFTIELKDAIPTSYKNQFDNWMFGCDVCQDVCPWNRFSKQHHESKFEPNPTLLSMNKKEWKEITEDIFNDLFKRSAVKRTKYEGLKRNIKFL